MMTETMLRQLYAWHLDLLLLAILKHQAALAEDIVAIDRRTESPTYERQNALFLEVVRTAGNPEHLAALAALSDRLEPVQRIERYFLDETEAETNEIVQALRTRDRKLLRHSLVRYHRRRERIVPELLAHLYRTRVGEGR